MLEKWFKGNSADLAKYSKEKIQEIELKHADLENKLLKSNVELEQIKAMLKETQISLQLVLSSYHGLAEEVSTLYEVMKAITSPSGRNDFRFSFRVLMC